MIVNYDEEIKKLHYCKEECFNECKKNISYKKSSEICNKYRFDRAKVGEDYGQNPVIPKIVFFGIEGLRDCEINYNVSKTSEIERPADNRVSNAHYNGVKYTLAYLLADFMGKSKPEHKVSKYCAGWLKEALTKYCLCNFYRCAFVTNDNLEMKRGLCHTKEMSENCTNKTIEEIKALEPDIIVIQWKCIPNIIKDKLINEFNLTILEQMTEDFGEMFQGECDGKPLIVLFTRHGADRRFKTSDYLKKTLNPLIDAAIEKYKRENVHIKVLKACKSIGATFDGLRRQAKKVLIAAGDKTKNGIADEREYLLSPEYTAMIEMVLCEDPLLIGAGNFGQHDGVPATASYNEVKLSEKGEKFLINVGL